ncbi:MAG: PilZ domain-containing protein [Pseudomonadota bacterium]
MTSDVESRRSFRVSEPAYLRYEILSDQEFDEGLERRKIRLGIDNSAQTLLVDIDARLSQAMHLMGSENGPIGRVLTILNDKIDVVANQLPGLRETKASMVNSVPQICDVGADGMVFSTRQPLPVGSKLYLEFLLEADSRYVETLATVIRNTDSPDPENTELSFGNAVEFHGMKAEQREILIQHMFNQESATLRLRRLQLDDENFA